MKNMSTKTNINRLNLHKRSGGRSANISKRSSELFKQSPWRLPINEDKPIEPITGEGVQTIHNGAMDIL